MNVRVTHRDAPQRSELYTGIVLIAQNELLGVGTIELLARDGGTTFRKVVAFPRREGTVLTIDNDGAAT